MTDSDPSGNAAAQPAPELTPEGGLVSPTLPGVEVDTHTEAINPYAELASPMDIMAALAQEGHTPDWHAVRDRCLEMPKAIGGPQLAVHAMTELAREEQNAIEADRVDQQALHIEELERVESALGGIVQAFASGVDQLDDNNRALRAQAGRVKDELEQTMHGGQVRLEEALSNMSPGSIRSLEEAMAPLGDLRNLEDAMSRMPDRFGIDTLAESAQRMSHAAEIADTAGGNILRGAELADRAASGMLRAANNNR